jgi:hypothetical protein
MDPLLLVTRRNDRSKNCNVVSMGVGPNDTLPLVMDIGDGANDNVDMVVSFFPSVGAVVIFLFCGREDGVVVPLESEIVLVGTGNADGVRIDGASRVGVDGAVIVSLVVLIGFWRRDGDGAAVDNVVLLVLVFGATVMVVFGGSVGMVVVEAGIVVVSLFNGSGVDTGDNVMVLVSLLEILVLGDDTTMGADVGSTIPLSVKIGPVVVPPVELPSVGTTVTMGIAGVFVVPIEIGTGT